MRIQPPFFRIAILTLAFLLFWQTNTVYGVDFKACECEVEIEPSDQEPELYFFYGWTNDMEAVKNVSAEFKYVPFGAQHEILLSGGQKLPVIVGTQAGSCGQAGAKLADSFKNGDIVSWECNESNEPPEAVIKWGKNVDDKENPREIEFGEAGRVQFNE